MKKLYIILCALNICLCTYNKLKAERLTVTNSNSRCGSLGQAVEDANALSGQDTILFAPNVRGKIYNTGVLELTDGLVMIGPGPI
ncbi:MAG: hypothetical protein U5J96_00590 [Ignavibacteriaceae bacterium]|nr:hypothetical protein [Ignavibacteriaceae bacterium]